MRTAGDRNEIDAVAISAIRGGYVMPEVRAIDTDRLAVLQAAHVLPDDFLVAEAGPPVLT